MKVRAFQYLDAELNTQTQRRVTQEYLEARFEVKLRNHRVDSQGALVRSEEISAGSHSYFEDRVVRQATELDKALLILLTAIAEDRA